MFDVDLAYPLSLGVVAAFNPCGFAMLPAYVSYFMGLETSGNTDAEPPSTARNVGRGLVVGLALTAGFVVVFGVIGILTNTVISNGAIESKIGYATTVFGILMVLMGAAMLFFKFEPKLNLPRLNKGGKTNDLWSIFLFGISYAVVSLSCTIGLFLAVVAGSFTQEGFINGTATFVAYAAGMGAVMMVLTLAVALAQGSVAKNMKKFLPYVNKVSGVMLMLAGVFLTIYGIWEVQIANDPEADNPLIDLSNNASSTVNQWANDAGPNRLAMGALVLIVAAVVTAVAGQLKSKRDKQVVVGAFVAVYAFIEIVQYKFDLLVLPTIRTIFDSPERVGNWFTDPFRWPVLFEVLLAMIFAAIIFFNVRSRFRTEVEDAGKTLEPV